MATPARSVHRCDRRDTTEADTGFLGGRRDRILCAGIPNLPAALAAAMETELVELLAPLGFHRQRAAHLVDLARTLRGASTCSERIGGRADAASRHRPLRGWPGDKRVRPRKTRDRHRRQRGSGTRGYGGVSTERYELRKSKEVAALGRMFSTTTREANWALLDLGARLHGERRPRCDECPFRLLLPCGGGYDGAIASRLSVSLTCRQSFPLKSTRRKTWGAAHTLQFDHGRPPSARATPICSSVWPVPLINALSVTNASCRPWRGPVYGCVRLLGPADLARAFRSV